MNAQQLRDRGIELHGQGRLDEAERAYRGVLAAEPDDFTALHLLGVLQGQRGRPVEALALIDAALGVDARAPGAWCNRGVLLAEMGRLDEALASSERAVALAPRDGDALCARARILVRLERFDAAHADYRLAAAALTDADRLNEISAFLCGLGRPDEALAITRKVLQRAPGDLEALTLQGQALAALGRLEAALASYDAVLAAAPDLPEGHVNRGLALSRLDRHAEALAAYDRALALWPDLAAAWSNRALALWQLGHLDAALADADRALALEPEAAEARNVRAKILWESGRIAEGFAEASAASALAWRTAAVLGGGADRPFKIAHDRQQAQHRAEAGLPPGAELQIVGGARLAGPAVEPANASSAARAWRAATPKIAVVDDFLTPAAVAELRRFCWGSAIWWASYDKGYVGAFPESGVTCPLLAQVAEEMRTVFPEVLGGHALRYVWAFKYDSAGGGTAPHADEAAVNVNFWITADEANLAPERGGLVFWDKAAPADWDFSQFNENEQAVVDFLARSDARPTTIPYRANRAVIFDSDLFHATDDFAFRDDYRSRRINITMLFGRRAAAPA